MADATVIVAKLDKRELENSINELVRTIDSKLTDAALSFDAGIGLMQNSLKTFANNARATVKEIKNAFTQLGTTFNDFANAMQAATRNASRGAASASGAASGGGGSSITAAPGTVGELRQQITEAQLLLDTYQQQSPALQSAVDKLVKQRNLLKQMLTDSETISKKNFGNLFAKYNAMPTRELSQAEEKLRNLRSLANIAPQGILGTAAWQRLQTAIDRTQAKVNQLEMSVASAPRTTQGVMGMSEKTLDDISRKMQAISQLRLGMNIKTQRGEITMLNNEYARLGKMQDSLLGKNVSLIDSNGALARSFTYIRNRIVYALTLGATTQFVRDLYEVRGQYELLERSLGVLTNSMQRGTQIFQELSQMALKSPFTLVELGTAAKQLTAYNFSANEVVDTTRRLADISAALGVPMERLTYNLGQIRAQTVLTARDARDFANAGLPMVKTLADYYSRLEGRVVSTGDVYDRMSKKMVSYNDVMAVLIEMTDEGGKFFDFQAKQADTLRVQMANLSLAWNNMLNDIGKANQSLLTTPLTALKTIFQNWRMIDKVLIDVAGIFGVVKAAQMALNLVMGSGVATMRSSILADKEKIAAELQRKALTQKLTIEELRLVATRRSVTAADYQQVLSSRALTKQQALMLAAFQRNNVELMKALVRMGLLTAAEVRNMTVGKALLVVYRGIGLSLASMASSFVSLLPMIGAVAVIGGAIHAWQSYREEVRKTTEMNNQAARNAKETSSSIGKFFEDYAESLNKINSDTNISDDKKKQVWEALQGEIEKSVVLADEYIRRLLQIEDVSERIKAGEAILKDAQRIQDVISILGDKQALKLGKGETFGQGIAKDLEQYVDEIKVIVEKYGDTVDTWVKINEILSNPDAYLNKSFWSAADPAWRHFAESAREAQSEVNATLQSMTDGFSQFREQILGDEPERFAENIRQYAEVAQREMLASEEGQKIQGRQLAQLKMGIDEWVAATIEAETNVISFSGDAVARQNAIYLARTKTAWEEFYKTIGLLGNKEQERLRELIQSGAYLQDEYATEFKNLWAKAANAMQNSSTESYNLIKNQILDLNTMRIVIPVLFKPQMNTDSDLQKQFDKDFQGQEFQFLRPKEEENIIKFGARATKELKERNEAYAIAKKQYDAIPASQKVLREEAKKQVDVLEAETKAAKEVVDSWHLIEQETKKNKGGKSSGAKKDVLGESLSKEVQLIDEIQKRFKEYRSMGVNSQNALSLATEEYGNSLDIVSKKLAQFGIKTKSTSELAQMDLRAVRDYYKSLLTIASGVGNTKGIEALEKAIAKINVEITKIDYKKITDSLNNELSKLKEEYELGVELDADPELSDIFLNLFDIDANELPKTIEDYAARVTDELNKAIAKRGDTLKLDSLLNLTPDDVKSFKIMVEQKVLNEQSYNEIKKMYDALRALRQKDQRDTLNKTRTLQYKLVDTYDKIAIETEKLETLRQRRARETRDEKKKLLDLEILDQEEVIARLKDEVLEMLPTYQNLFNSIADHSAHVTRRIAKQWKEALENAVQNANGTWTITDPLTGETATISAQKYGKEIKRVNDKLRETQNAFAKIKEAFTKGEDGTVDWAQGVMFLTGEIDKGIDGLREVATIMEELGASDDAVEIMSDIADTLEGVSTASKGIAQIASGDFIGGAANVIKGTWEAISSWFDNKNKKIDRKIADSEVAVRRLRLEYQKLEYAVEKALGTAETEARRAAIANKEAQLAEVERQLALEQQKDYKKGSDKREQQERIDGYLEQVESLRQEIQDAKEDIVNNLLGSDVKSAAEDFVNTWVNAWNQGETTLDAIRDKMNEMVENLINKAVTSRLVANLLQPMYDAVDTYAKESSEGGVGITMNEIRALASLAQQTSVSINDTLGAFYANLEALGVMAQSAASGQELSSLQQGIQGITETTANALEAYMNGVLQQVYLHSTLLTEIRDFLIPQEGDIQLDVQAQMLLQLQASYQTQEAIRSMLEGWNNASGQAVRVEII